MKSDKTKAANGSEKRPAQSLPKPPHPRISRLRLWLFRLIAVTVVPALSLLLPELVLRIVGFGYPTSTLVKSKLDGKDIYCSNHKFAWRFFPPQLSHEFIPFVVPVQKSENTCRIFVFGGSAAQSTPDKPSGFARFLRLMLRHHYPNVNFEIHNTAMPAVNSHVIREIARDCAKHKPDIYIFYMGNNEVVGPYGPGTIFSPFSANLSLVRLGITARSTRLGQLFTRIVRSASPGGHDGTFREMDLFLEKQVRADDPRLRTAYDHFHANLEDLAQIARNADAKIILCTVGSNLKDCPP